MRPLVGVTASVTTVTASAWTDDSVHVPVAYVRALRTAGAEAVVLPPGAVGESTLSRLDALVLSGGRDVAPSTYGASPHPLTVDTDQQQDDAEITLVREALARDLPLLGVCRGMQVMAVACGGRLVQHLPDVAAHARHGAWGGGWTDHPVALEPGSRTAALLGDRVVANSGHHQGVADPGHLTVTGRSPDGLPEVVEDPTRRFCVGVQWHPEMTGHQALFTGLVEAVVARATAR